MKTVLVGSQNPVKIGAVRLAFSRVWPEEEWKVDGVDVESGVTDQPMSDVESITGARNRAAAVFEANDSVAFGVGLEGGIQQIGEKWFDCGWMVVRRADGVEGVGSSVRAETPPRMMRLIREGAELGEVVDEVFGTENAKQAKGHFGLMTNGVITRERGYVDGVVMALTRFLHEELWE